MSISWLWYLIGTLCVGGLIALPLLLAEAVLRRPLVLAHFRLIYLAAILLTLFPLGRNQHWAAGTELLAASVEFLGLNTEISDSMANKPLPVFAADLPVPLSAVPPVAGGTAEQAMVKDKTAAANGFEAAISAAASTPAKYSRWPGLAFYLVVLYGFSVLFLWAKQIWRLFLWRKRIRECCAITHGRVFDLFTEAKRLADCPFSVTLRDGGALLPIPASFGCGQWRTVLCPLREQENFSDAELKMLMIHELTHLKHSDNQTAFILCMVSNLCWFNPFIRLFGKRAVMGFELDCDNAVRRTMNLSGSAAASYAKLLLQYQMQSNNKALRPVLTSGLSTTAKELKVRIQELKMKSKKRYAFLLIMIMISGIITGCCLSPSLRQSAKAAKAADEVTKEAADAEFSAQTAFKLFPAATRGMVYVDAARIWRFVPFMQPAVSSRALILMRNFCKNYNVKAYAAYLPPEKDYANGGNFDNILIKADCELNDFHTLVTTLMPAGVDWSATISGKTADIFIDDGAGGVIHITIKQIGDRVYHFTKSGNDNRKPASGVPELLQDSFKQAVTQYSVMAVHGLKDMTALDNAEDNILVFAGMGQDDNYRLCIGRPELKAKDYNMQLRVFELNGQNAPLFGVNFALNNITNPQLMEIQNKTQYDDNIAQMLVRLGGGVVCPVEQLLAIPAAINFSSKDAYGNFSYQAVFSNDEISELSKVALKNRYKTGEPQISGTPQNISTELLYTNKMIYGGWYDIVRDPELGMRLAASENGRRFLQEFAGKCANILLSGQINPDELASELNYADGYRVNSDNTPERKMVTAVRLLMADVVTANNWLKTPEKSVALFKELAARQSQIAQYAWYVVRDTVMEHGDFALAAQFYPDPVAIFNDFAQNTTQIINRVQYAQYINEHRERMNRTAGNLLKLAEYQKNSAAVQQIKDGIKQFNTAADERVSRL